MTAAIQMPQWVAQEGSQRLFLSCPIQEILFEGTRGPGKTDALLVKFAKYTGLGFGSWWHGIIFRETYKQLQDVVEKSKRLFYPNFPGVRFTGSASDYAWRWPSGETLLLRYYAKPDDYNNYHGHEYPFIGWEELTNWITLEGYHNMKTLWRSSAPFPSMPRIYAATCNPFGKGHNAVKAYYQLPQSRGRVIRDDLSPWGRVAIHGTIFENKVLLRNDPTYLSKLQAIADPNRRKAWLYGSWDINVGSMFDDLWRSEVHIIEPFALPPDWRIERSLDWGSSRPFSVGWWAVTTDTPAVYPDGRQRTFPRGSYIRIGEWYGWNGEPNKGLRLPAFTVALGVREREVKMGISGRVKAGPADSSIYDQEEGNSIAKEFERANVMFVPAHKAPGSRKQGWQRIRQLMDNATYGDEAGLYVFSTCDQFIRTVPSLPRDDVDLDDVNTDAEDHIGDETRYMVLRKPKTASQTNQY